MKLSVNLVSGNRYYRAGEDIPDNEVPVHAAKWAVDPRPPTESLPKGAPHPQRENKGRKPGKR